MARVGCPDRQIERLCIACCSRPRGAPHSRRAFTIGFLAGRELVWLPEVLRAGGAAHPARRAAGDRDHAGEPVIAGASGRTDARQAGCGVAPPSRKTRPVFKRLVSEPLVAVPPAGHCLPRKPAVLLNEKLQLCNQLRPRANPTDHSPPLRS